ncbi:DUF4124 domain-containing protein [Aquisalimonas lutea]|uniref:DUF4124 domain-containing protein n=1 Tax=Aquisalimonas lutea TaxID=1327750 RepID=UPI0025B2F582|nr:DUF4124 domain-containing protein [Aquisalimonas lutea]MDN3519682.1 DUF4124 domain-containing protein [Aquisalimonas lutea]
MHIRKLPALLLGVALATSAGAEIYRWTDDSGQVHYGGNPPANVDAEVVDNPAREPAGQGGEDEPPAETAEAKDGSGDEAADGDASGQDGDSGEQAGSNAEGESNPQLAEACDTARQNAEVFGDESVRRVRTEDGEVERITPEQREQRLQEAQAFIEEHC